MNIDKEISDRVAKLRAIRQANHQGAQIVQSILTEVHEGEQRLEQMKREIDDMQNYLQQDNNQYIKALLQIYDALGYTDDVPQLQQGEILWAIDAVHKAALAKGYKWDGRQYSNGNKIVTLDYVASRVTAELAEVTA